jgi:uroporphyrinogen-III synthase
MPFDGLRVLSLESRRAREMETLIVRHGGVPFVAPSVEEHAVQDSGAALRLIAELELRQFDLLVCMTGAAVRFLMERAAASGCGERLAAALRGVSIVARGPKPVAVLRPMGVPVAVTVPEPNTWREVVQAVAARAERRIAVLEYGRPNLELNRALAASGAEVTPFALYRWVLPSDAGPLREAVRRLAAGGCEVALFTSSIQIDHLLEVARAEGMEEAVLEALRSRVVVGSVGPVMTSSLAGYGIAAAVVPRQPKMWALVKAAAEQAHAALLRRGTRPVRTF